MKKLMSCAVMLMLAPAAGAYGAQTAGLPGAYLDFVGGPRLSGMGRAYVGLAEGADAVSWNPGGLGFLRPNVVGFMHTQTEEQARLDYVGYAQPIYRWGALGLAYTRLDSGALPQTDEFNRTVGQFRDLQQAFMAGYGLAVHPRLSLGGTFKFAQQSLSGASAKGWGMDLGALAKLQDHYQAGVRVRNLISPRLSYDSGVDSFSRVVTLGLAGKWLQERLAVTADVERGADSSGDVNWRLGAEGTLWRVVKLRAGFDFAMKEFSVGVGYQWGRSSVGAAIGSNQYGFAQKVGMDYAFGGYDLILSAAPEVFSPMGLTKRTIFAIKLNHSTPIDAWVFEIRNQHNDVVYKVMGSGRPPTELTWDGRTSYGMVVAPGAYGATLNVTDKNGRTEITPVQTVRVQYGTPLDELEISVR
ncbi:MAG TPA: hypothetical protein DEB40_09640 [Elusimicrobia bacterium]|nr:hypothetical protein [Elusimicrobiota bacterium]HBT61991.1 hypothetical protein [Elusimicrobiota bacterium]